MRSTLATLAVLAGFTLALPFLGAPLGGCIANNAADGGAEGGSSSSSSSGDGGSSGTTVQGADCITEPSTGIQICTAISICPKVIVDHDVYPNCGFRIRGQTIDLECACSGEVCPVGAPTTCDQAAKLLADQTELQVCQQLSEGRCTPGAGSSSGSSGASGSSGSSTSSCDKTCASECAGDPNCVRLCGC